MAKSIKNTSQELQEFNKTSAELVSVLNDLASVLDSNAKAAEKFTGDSAKNFKESFKESISLSKQLSGYTIDQLKSRKEEANFLKSVAKVQQEQARVQSKIAFLRDRLVNATAQERVFLKQSLKTLIETDETLQKSLEHSEKLKKVYEDISKQTGFFDNLADLTNSIPGVSKVFKEFQKASDAAREAAATGGKGLSAGAKELFKGFTKALSVFTLGKIVAGLKDFDERTVSIGRNLNRTRQESDAIVQSFNKAGASIVGLTGDELQNAAQNYSEALGSTGIVSEMTSKTLATQVKYLGMSSEEANSLLNYSQATGKEYTNFTNTLIGEVKLSNLRNKTGVLYQKVLKDIANTSNATKLLMDKQGRSLGQAGIEAQKLGATIDQIAAAGKNMLNFEESIAAELEAELISGKEINNEKARAAALTGDQEKLMKALNEDQALQKFEAAKTVIEQESIAKAYGMQASEMADMLVKSKAMSALKADDQKDLQKTYSAEIARIDALKAQGRVMEANKLQQELSEKIGNDELERQLYNNTLLEKQDELMKSITQAFGVLNRILIPIGKMLDFLQTKIDYIQKALSVILGNKIVSKFTGFLGKAGSSAAEAAPKVVKDAKGVNRFAAGAVNAAGESIGGRFASSAAASASQTAARAGIFKTIGKYTGKILKLPVISAIIESYFANSDIMSTIFKGGSESAIYKKIGARSVEALSSMGGAAIGAAVGSLLGPLGTFAGGLLGDLGGRAAAKLIMGDEGPEGFGRLVSSTFGYDKDIEEGKKAGRIQVEDFVLQTHPKDTLALVGGTQLSNNKTVDETNTLLRELISAVKAGGNIYIGPHKLNEAIGLNLHSIT